MSIPVTYWPDGALQGNVPVNDSLQSLSALGQAQVEQTLNAPPTTVLADVGKMWQVGTSPTGVWATPTRANNLALCTAAGVWRYFAPGTNAWLIWDKAALQMKRWDGSAWSVFASTSGSTSKGHIDGLKMTWVSGTALTVTTGEAYVEGNTGVVAANSNIAKSSLSLSASTMYHVYLYLNGASPDIEIVTTAPAAAYSGSARSKTGDTSRRYIGSIITTASGSIAKFQHDLPCTINYDENINAAPYVVVSGGSATSATSVSCSAVVPTTGRSAILMANNNATGQYVYMSTSNAVNSLSTSFWKAFIVPVGSFRSEYRLDGAQAFNYMYDATPSGGNAFIRVTGYTFER